MNRRAFLAGCTAAAMVRSTAQSARVRRELFQAAPGNGTAVMAYAYYARASGGEMISIEQRWSRSDTIDVAFYRRSSDHGRTWGPPEERKTGERTAAGMLRRHLRGFWVEPRTGLLIEWWNEGVLANDDPLEGLRQWAVCYRVSKDGGRTWNEPRSIEPLEGVQRGRNCAMLGDNTCRPVSLPDGSIALPVSITPVDAEGKLFNPGGGYTYHDAAVIRLQWNSAREGLTWRLGQRLKGDPARSTRGLVEPTIARLTDGRLLMVMRGSNDRQPDLPGIKWYSLSRDGGASWSETEPWSYDDRTVFYSPSACSQLLEHSSGRLFWLGNITPDNPKGNRPRYPFVIGEVDRRTGLLLRRSLVTIDDRQPQDDPLLTLSNFYAREDRETREVALHMTRLLALEKGWQGDGLLYRVRV